MNAYRNEPNVSTDGSNVETYVAMQLENRQLGAWAGVPFYFRVRESTCVATQYERIAISFKQAPMRHSTTRLLKP